LGLHVTQVLTQWLGGSVSINSDRFTTLQIDLETETRKETRADYEEPPSNSELFTPGSRRSNLSMMAGLIGSSNFTMTNKNPTYRQTGNIDMRYGPLQGKTP
jgi:hypothetical protein